MDNPPQNDRNTLAARVTELEELCTHQERLLQQLDEVILQQDRRLSKTESTLTRLVEKLETFSHSADTVQSPEDERPPHY